MESNELMRLEEIKGQVLRLRARNAEIRTARDRLDDEHSENSRTIASLQNEAFRILFPGAPEATP